jgi:hypothetical protein
VLVLSFPFSSSIPFSQLSLSSDCPRVATSSQGCQEGIKPDSLYLFSTQNCISYFSLYPFSPPELFLSIFLNHILFYLLSFQSFPSLVLQQRGSDIWGDNRGRSGGRKFSSDTLMPQNLLLLLDFLDPLLLFLVLFDLSLVDGEQCFSSHP